ncbi:MAG TPA: hypothetical protein VIN56_06925 [Candidatus Dormibacteraeota bacterium]
MRQPLITAGAALRERISNYAQVAPTAPEAELPPYLASFLAHLRLLIGVPFEYLVPDARLLPPESIRFFYLDRSWTDRLIDGVIAVGKLGTRDQSHHQEQNPALASRLDGLEKYVRDMQRALLDYEGARNAEVGQAGTVTGFLLRSAAVAGWPHMEVRAFDRILPEQPDLTSPEVEQARVPLLRLERLSPSVLIAIFDGIPKLVWCEEPHHGVQFGVKIEAGRAVLFDRSNVGVSDISGEVQVPFRQTGRRVLHMVELRRQLTKEHAAHNTMPVQNGSADLAIEVLDVPWRQRFQGQGAIPELTGSRVFTSNVSVAGIAAQQSTIQLVERLVQG